MTCVPSRSLLRRALGGVGVWGGLAAALAVPVVGPVINATGRSANTWAHVTTPTGGAKVRGGHRELDAPIEPQSSSAVWLRGGSYSWQGQQGGRQGRSVGATDGNFGLPAPGGGIGIESGIYSTPSTTGASHEDEDADDPDNGCRRACQAPERGDVVARHRG